MEVALWISLAYLLGSLTPGLWLARAYGVDIRKVGSGNIGSTNVYRVLGFWAGVLVQVVDIGKALVSVGLAKLRAVPEAGLYAVATAAVLGHIYPIWAGFRGGKGINTLLGGMLLIEPLSALAATGTFLIFLSLSWIVSVSSLAGVASFLLWHGVVGEGGPIGYLAGGLWLGLVLYTHRQNLARLLAGKEPRIGQKSS